MMRGSQGPLESKSRDKAAGIEETPSLALSVDAPHKALAIEIYRRCGIEGLAVSVHDDTKSVLLQQMCVETLCEIANGSLPNSEADKEAAKQLLFDRVSRDPRAHIALSYASCCDLRDPQLLDRALDLIGASKEVESPREPIRIRPRQILSSRIAQTLDEESAHRIVTALTRSASSPEINLSHFDLLCTALFSKKLEALLRPEDRQILAELKYDKRLGDHWSVAGIPLES